MYVYMCVQIQYKYSTCINVIVSIYGIMTKHFYRTPGLVPPGERRTADVAARYDGDDAHVRSGAHGVCAHRLPSSIHQGRR